MTLLNISNFIYLYINVYICVCVYVYIYIMHMIRWWYSCINVTAILIVVGSLGTVFKILEKLQREPKTIKTTALKIRLNT